MHYKRVVYKLFPLNVPLTDSDLPTTDGVFTFLFVELLFFVNIVFLQCYNSTFETVYA